MKRKKKNQQPSKRANEPSVSNQQFIRFVGAFILSLILFYIVYSSHFFTKYITNPFISVQGEIGVGLLNIMGYATSTSDNILTGNGVTLNIMKGCDGIEAIAIYCIGVLLMPFKWGLKLKGVAAGALFFILLNIFRIILLFLVQLYQPNWFDALHIHGGYVLFMLLAMVMWLLWVRWALSQQNQIKE